MYIFISKEELIYKMVNFILIAMTFFLFQTTPLSLVFAQEEEKVFLVDGVKEDENAFKRTELFKILRTAPPAPNPSPKTKFLENESAMPDHIDITVYDIATGKELVIPHDANQSGDMLSIFPFTPPPPQNTDADAPGIEPAKLNESLDATELTPIPDATTYPWATIHKLLMRFNVDGKDYYYVCSGWTAGEFQVGTAGHCIYNWDPNGDGDTSDKKWADEIWVWAGQGDVVDPEDSPDQPFGTAKSVLLRSYAGWTNSQDLNHDWGIITLNRRDGIHTGWMGRESTVASALNFSGYPVETPYIPAGSLIQWHGFGNTAGSSDYRINLEAYIYGGHSGGPSWRYTADTGDRYIEGIHSTSNRAGNATDTRLTSGKLDSINNFIAEDESNRSPIARPDLQEFFFDANNSKDLLANSVNQGESFQINYNVLNSGFALCTNFTITFYLSTNTTISTSDTSIGTRTTSLEAWSYLNTTTSLTVPTNMPEGTYYVGWIIGGCAEQEYTTDNNTVVIANETLTVRANSQIHDIALLDFWPDATPVPADQDVRFNLSIKNEGNYTEDITSINSSWQGPLGELSTAQITLEQPLIDFAPGETKELYVMLSTPAQGGSYNLKLSLPAVTGEADTADNEKTEAVSIQGTQIHDIALLDFWPDTTPIPADQDVRFNLSIKNEGNYTEDITSINSSWQGPLGELSTAQFTLEQPLIDFAPGETKELYVMLSTPAQGGSYNLKLSLPAVTGEADTADNEKTEAVSIQGTQIHDIALLDFWPDATPVPADQDVRFNLSIKNEGNYTEDITSINSSWQGPLGELSTAQFTLEQPLIDFAPGETKELYVILSTPAQGGSYNLKLSLPAVTGEADTADNEKTEAVIIEGGDPQIRISPTTLDIQEDSSTASLKSEKTTFNVENTQESVKISLTFTPDQLSFNKNGDCDVVTMTDAILPEDTPGTPGLPAMYINVLIPSGANNVSAQVNGTDHLVAQGITICPVQPPSALSSAAPTIVQPNESIYTLDTLLPKQLSEITGTHTSRGYTFVSLRINPVRYNPSKGEVYLVENFNLDILYDLPSSPRKAPATNNQMFENMIRRMIINGDMMDDISFPPSSEQEAPLDTVDYLIITNNSLAQAFQNLANHRMNYNGFTTQIITVEEIYQNTEYNGRDNQEEIRNCIENYVSSHSTIYVILGGDDTIIPDRDCYVSVNNGDEVESNMPTDLYYAGLDSSWDEDGDGVFGEADTSSGDEGDLAPDVIVGRIPIRTASGASAYIQKLINHENNPPSDAFKNKFLILGDTLWDTYSDSDRPSDSTTDGFASFQSHSPVSDAEMWGRRLYRDGIQSQLAPNTLDYFFDTLTSWDSSSAGDYVQNTSNVAARFNEGWYNIFFGTHGNQNIWGLENNYFDDTTASQLTGETTIIYTMACLTGHFDGTTDPCLSEAFLRNPNGGALAYFGCSRYGWGMSDPPPASNTSVGGPSIDYSYKFYNELQNIGNASLGEIFTLHKIVLAGSCSSNGAYRWVQFGMNYQGDPAYGLNPGASSPDNFTIYNDGTGSLDISMINQDQEPWLTWSPTDSITIPPGGSRVVSVFVNWEQLSASVDGGRIVVNSNDTDLSPYPDAVLVTARKKGMLSVTPSSNFASSGCESGEFTPSSTSYTLTNTGGASIAWQATKGQIWVTISPSSGNLEPNNSTIVTVTINSNADALSPNTYSDTVHFNNTTNASGNTTRSVALEVTSCVSDGNLEVNPTDGLTASGCEGGPFSPSSKTYTLSNTGGTSIAWQATKGQSWVSISPSSGNLAPSDTTSVTVTINSSADSLSQNTYSDTIHFNNTTNGSGNTTTSINLSVNECTKPTLDLGSGNGCPGGEVEVPLTLTNVPGTDISAVSIDIGFNAAIFEYVSAEIGPAGTAAGKDLVINSPSSGLLRVGAVDISNNIIGDGVVARIKFRINNTVSINDEYILTNTPSASFPSGDPVSINGSNSTIQIVSCLCGDCNNDSSVTIDEVQSAINMYLGQKQVESCADCNNGGSVSIDEVQKIINNYLNIAPNRQNITEPSDDLPSLDLSQVSGHSGNSVQIPIKLTNIPGVEISALSMDIIYDTDILDSPTVVIGPAGTAAEKTIVSNEPEFGTFRVGVLSMSNNNSVEDGMVAYVSFNIKPDASTGKTTLVNISSASDPSGGQVSIEGADGIVRVNTIGAMPWIYQLLLFE